VTVALVSLYLLGGVWPFTVEYLDEDRELAPSLLLAVFWPVTSAAMVGAALLDGLLSVGRWLNGRSKGAP
jgi:hypothetical protein